MGETNYWLRHRQATALSRRRFVGGAAAAGLGATALGLVGCGDDDDDDTGGTSAGTSTATSSSGTGTTATAAPSQTPVTGGEYVTAFTGPFAGADPHNSVYGGAGIVPEVYNYLFRTYQAFVPERGIIYDLAESHKLESDNVTMVFKLRGNAKVAPNSQGIPERALDSSDALASWTRIADAASGSNGYAFTSKWVDKFDAPDATTFRIIFKKPYAWGEAQVGNNLVGAIVPKELLATADFKAKPMGAGPFKLVQLEEGNQARMERNPNYWKEGHPYLDALVIRAFADQTTWRTAFQSSQCDYYAATSADEAKELVNSNKQLQYENVKGISYNSFWMNTKIAPWSDPRVRQAVNLATNREQYIALIGKGKGEPIGPVTYAFGDYALSEDELSKAQPYNVNDAKKLFEEAGVKEFEFQHPTSSNMSDYVTIFVQQMQQAGVTATPKPLDAGTWVAGYYTSQLSASLSLNQSYQTPDNAVQWWATGGITGNGHYDTGFSDAEIDAAIEKAASTLDAGARGTAYKDLQKLILSKSPPFFNFFGRYDDILLQPYIQGYQFGAGALNYAYEDSFFNTKG